MRGISKKRGASLAVAIALLSTLALVASGALAASPSAVSRSKIVETNSTALVNAECPKGKAPVSGGFRLDPDDGALMNNSLEGVGDGKKSWTANTATFGGSGRSTVFAYCARFAKNMAFRSDRTTLDYGESATVTATCRRGERVMSGGYAFVNSGTPFSVVTQSFRAGARAWSAEAFNFVENRPTTFLVFAHCRPEGKVPALRTVRQTEPFNDDGSPTDVAATCPRGRYALSGGYRTPGEDFTWVVNESRREGSGGWTAAAGGASGGDDEFTVFAYCAKK
ncbi:hypothetical protein HJD18_02925 [Thermoleophilia bacterium SCSIO 60948]|nr:hypothetical protein HJD18_02925 [Thermoleophilia bacterium SCSIO 60948]